MEFVIGELRENMEAKKNDRAHLFAEFLLFYRGVLRRKPDFKRFKDTLLKCNLNNNEEREKPEKPDTPKVAEPEPDLEDVHLRYIPDYMRELRTKTDYWKKEFLHWNDIISQKNWKLYDKKLKDCVDGHKDHLKELDGLIQTVLPSSEDKNYFLQSLDPNRVQNLVTAIKEKENEDNLFEDMMKLEEPDYRKELIRFAHIMYAIYATYPKDSLLVKEED